MKLPRPFIENIVRIWGDQGVAWLKELPDLIKFFSIQWQLNDVKPFDNLSFNYVARAYSNYYNQPIVLKIGIPCPQFINEAKALECYGGNGCVKLLAHDFIKHGMLLALIQPGTTVRSFFPEKDEQAVEFACQVMKKLHARSVDSKSDFPTMDQWLSLFDTLEVPEDLKKYVAKARELAQELKLSPQEQHLLHGDLHHDNILLSSSGSGIAIDPKGVIGEQAYEVGAFMCNPAELSAQSDFPAIIARRLDLFSKILDIEQDRLAKACYVRVILSACWIVQDKGDWRDDVRFAEQIIKH